MYEVPTVKIKRDSELGYIIINEEHYDPKTMELYGESKPTDDAVEEKSAVTAKKKPAAKP